MVSGFSSRQRRADAPLLIANRPMGAQPHLQGPEPTPGVSLISPVAIYTFYTWTVWTGPEIRPGPHHLPHSAGPPSIFSLHYPAARTMPKTSCQCKPMSLCALLLFPGSLGLVCLDPVPSPLLLPLRLLGLLVPPVPVAIVAGFCRLGARLSLDLLALDADKRVRLAALGRLESPLLGLLPLRCTTLNLVP